MNSKQKLTNKNFLLFAANNYYNQHIIDTDDFLNDLYRFKYLKKLLNKYIETGALSERLILNHIIILSNVFGINEMKKMLEFKMEKKHFNILKPLLLYLGYIRENEYINIVMDEKIIKALRKI